MKKIVSLLLVVCTCVFACASFVSCNPDHDHVYSEQWSKDAEYHWHACETAGCKEVSDKAEHTWVDGVCSVCEAKEDEPATPADGAVTEQVWNEAIEIDNFDNVTFTFEGEFIEGDSQQPFSMVCLIDGDNAIADGEVFDAEQVASLKSVYINTTLAIIENFSDFTYDAEKGTYNGKKDIVYEVDVMGIPATITASDVVVTLDSENAIATVACIMTQDFFAYGEEQTFVLDITFSFSNYGTTVLS